MNRITSPSRLAAVAASLILFAGCRHETPQVKAGTEVKIDYKLTVDGEVVDTSEGREPLTYVQGEGQIIPGLERELAGLTEGATKHVTVQPEDGYGAVNPAAVQKLPRSAFGENAQNLEAGMVVTGQNAGRPVQAKVVAVGPKEITLDMNHPLAGKTLEFDVKVVSVKPGGSPEAPAQDAEAPAADAPAQEVPAGS